MTQNKQQIDETIQELTHNEDTLLLELYRHGGHAAKQKNKYSCVFCNSSDALSVYRNKTGSYIYKCFSCGETGDVINLVEKKENIEFYQAVKTLCEKNSIAFNIGPAQKTSRAVKSKVVDFYNKKSEEAIKEGNLEEAFRNSCEADRQQQNNYYLEFPYLDAKNNPLKIWENVEALLNKLEIKPVYNTITKEIEMLGTESTDYNNQIIDIHSECHKHGLKVTIDYLVKAVNRAAEKNKYNPVINYLEQCEFLYDNKPGHIKELCETLIVPDDFSKDLRDRLVTKWLLNTANIAFNEGYSNTEGCLVIQGPQGCGKTSWIKHLVPREFLKTGLDLDPSDRDSIRKCIKYWIVELGELDATMKADQAKLKAFITESVDEYRVPYAISPTRYNRTTNFYGTVNKNDFLKDETGDRRYWVIPVKEIDIDKLRSLDIKQIWGEAMSLLPTYKDNLNLNKEELEELYESNSEFRVKGNTQILVETGFIWDMDKSEWIFTPTVEIARHLGLKTTGGLKQALEAMGAVSTRKRVNGKQVRGYLVPPFIYID